MKARRILDEAMNLGNDPDLINPLYKQALGGGNHPFAKNPAFQHQGAPPGQPNPHEAMTVASYKNVMDAVRRYHGSQPRSMREIMPYAVKMFQTLEVVKQKEAEHKPELEQLAVETVLRIPEYAVARRSIESGDLHIEAHLDQPDLTAAKTAAEQAQEEEPEEAAVPEIRQELEQEVHKRRFLNMLTHGAAVRNDYAFSYYAEQELNQIDPDLIQDYGQLMSLTQLGYYVQGPAVAQHAAGAHGQEEQGGSSNIRTENDGSTTIVAYGTTFPFLVHEIVKGLMEYLSINDAEDPQTRQYAMSRADLIDEEGWAMMMGPAIWKKFLDAVGSDSREVVPYLYDEINAMPTSQFNALMQHVIAGDPRGTQMLRDLAARIKSELS